ncbi:hypothetical protein [Streptomyces sp. NPDC001985]|uniref:hypothetical protein n=1 Tax=Streptomyces sp. NPDC001985 TaxID=3154406 RepID=UPI00331F4A5C
MPDRRRRTDLLLPRERQSTDDNNPFAPPPEGKPDQPWQPRQPSNSNDNPDQSGSGSSDGSSDGSSGDRGGRGGWGGQWSSRQPGRSSGGGFGGRPGPNGQNGDKQGPSGGMRWDPTDPSQRRARYALLSGMWAFFFAIFDFTEIALLLGALALYWSISSLRAPQKSGRVGADAMTAPAPAPPAGTAPGAAQGGDKSLSNRSQRTAAVTGLVMGGIALAIVAAAFTAQLVYRDFYTCERDALTKEAQLSCNQELPKPLRDVIGVKE